MNWIKNKILSFVQKTKDRFKKDRPSKQDQEKSLWLNCPECNKMELKDKLVVFKDASFNHHISGVDASFQTNVEVSGNFVVRGETTATKINFSDELLGINEISIS